MNDEKAPSLQRITGVTPNSDIAGKTTGFSLRAAVSALPAEQFETVLSMFNDIKPQEARGIALVTFCSNYLKTINKPGKTASQKSSGPTH